MSRCSGPTVSCRGRSRDLLPDRPLAWVSDSPGVILRRDRRRQLGPTLADIAQDPAWIAEATPDDAAIFNPSVLGWPGNSKCGTVRSPDNPLARLAQKSEMTVGVFEVEGD